MRGISSCVKFEGVACVRPLLQVDTGFNDTFIHEFFWNPVQKLAVGLYPAEVQNLPVAVRFDAKLKLL